MPATHLLFDEYLTPTALPAEAPAVDVAAVDGAPALPPAPPRADDGPAHRSPRTGQYMRGQFLAFWTNYGGTLCGEPLTDEVLIDGRRAQVFERIVLQEVEPGRVAPMDIGMLWLETLAEGRRRHPGVAGGGLVIADRVAEMAALAAGEHDGGPAGLAPAGPAPAALAPAGPAAAGYPRRTLADIRYIVVHHTGAAPSLGPEAIAREHGQALGWPGIGYHFVVDADGGVHQTQDLTVASHHARQFNPAAVGVALCGNFDAVSPPSGQLDRAAALIAHLIDRLGLPLDAVRGHGEIVATNCPGLTFIDGWRATLLEAVTRHAGRTMLRAEERAITASGGAIRAFDIVAEGASVESAGTAAP